MRPCNTKCSLCTPSEPSCLQVHSRVCSAPLCALHPCLVQPLWACVFLCIPVCPVSPGVPLCASASPAFSRSIWYVPAVTWTSCLLVGTDPSLWQFAWTMNVFWQISATYLSQQTTLSNTWCPKSQSSPGDPTSLHPLTLFGLTTGPPCFGPWTFGLLQLSNQSRLWPSHFNCHLLYASQAIPRVWNSV